MIIGERLRVLREEKRLSRGDMEKRTGLLRCYICRVENGYTVPAVETLTKFAIALGVPMYRLFYDRKKPPKLPPLNSAVDGTWGSSVDEADDLRKLRRDLGNMSTEDRGLLLFMAQQMVDGQGGSIRLARRGRIPAR